MSTLQLPEYLKISTKRMSFSSVCVRITEEKKEKIRKMRESGYSYEEISKHLKCSKDSAQKYGRK